MNLRSLVSKRLHSPVSADPSSYAVSANTYFENGNQWYLPVIAGPSTFAEEASSATTMRGVVEVLNGLTPDRYLDFILRFYERGLNTFGGQWIYADINTVLYTVSKMIQPKDYLEIGVRRGRSLAMVVSQSPGCNVTGFDLWLENYAGMENPGEPFVRAELQRMGHRGSAMFIAGDSHATVPEYFRSNPNAFFDLITVDGDHSVRGARHDLEAVLPRLKVGGVIVFDDTCNQSHPGLSELWVDIVVDNPAFAAFTFNEVGFGVGFAVRKLAANSNKG